MSVVIYGGHKSKYLIYVEKEDNNDEDNGLATTRTTTTETKQRDNANEDNDNIDTKIFPPKEVFNKKFKFKDLHSLLCLCLVCQSV